MKHNRFLFHLPMLWLILAMICIFPNCVNATSCKYAAEVFDCKRYESNSGFVFTGTSKSNMNFGAKSLGKMMLACDAPIVKIKDNNTFILDNYSSQNISFAYEDIKTLEAITHREDLWRLEKENTKEIGGTEILSKNMGTGCIIVQKTYDASLYDSSVEKKDGNTSEWQIEYIKCDAFKKNPEKIELEYTPLKTDLAKGCFYRVFVLYKTRRYLGKEKRILLDKKNYRYTYHTESYSFHMMLDELKPTGVPSDESEIGFLALEEAVDAENIGGLTSVYYRTARDTINACFDATTGKFMYYIDETPYTIEVPYDQYYACLALMKRRIEKGLVPGVKDPLEAANLIIQGQVTYAQAYNIASTNKVDAIKVNKKNGAIIDTSSLSVGQVVELAVGVWNGTSVDEALIDVINTSFGTDGIQFLYYVIASTVTQQILAQTSLNSLLVPGTTEIVKAMGPKAYQALANATRDQGAKIFGGAAINNVARGLRADIVTTGILAVIYTTPNVFDLFNNRISLKQFIKNESESVGMIVGFVGGAKAGAAIGTAVVPGLGTVGGAILGAISGGVGSIVGSSALGFVADLFIDDDSEAMKLILLAELNSLTIDYYMKSEEVDEVVEALAESISGKKKLKDMYASDNRNLFARNMLVPMVEDAINDREVVSIPSDEELFDKIVNFLETTVSIYDQVVP